MLLPFVLAGPILRRVEPNLVSVWVALREPCTLKLALWEGGQIKPGDRDPLIAGPDPATNTLRVGAQLHIATVALKLPAGKTLRAGQIYSYDLTFQTPAGPQTLKSLGLLKDELGRHLALGFETDVLPSFAACPPELNQLKIVHGSCRRASANLPDGLAWLDEALLAKDQAYTDALKRPHQLFLTGDQIYADDVSRPHLFFLNDLGQTLIGTSQDNTVPIEQLPAVGQSFPADLVHFPAGFRLKLTRNEAGMTSSDGHSHLLSFGEFCAMYLTVWSNACWPDSFADVNQFVPETSPDDLPWFKALKAKGETDLLDALDAPRDPGQEENKDALIGSRESYEREIEALTNFRRTLPRVRRALANVPTYMMFDDHEVTDDWYINPMWRDRVIASPLGLSVIRNAMLAYALFQGWGNDPARFEGRDPETADYKKLLDQTALLFPAEASSGPNKDAAQTIDDLMGIPLRNQMGANGEFAETNPPLKWHYSVTGEKHVVRVLDCRTRRSFTSRYSPPGNIATLRFDVAGNHAVDAQADQLPLGPLPAGKEMLIVVASLQVLAPPIFDELLAPLLVRIFDVKDFSDLQENRGTQGMPGTNPDAVEGWAFDPKTFEALLERLASYGRVVLLSGDVHYAASHVMSYWKKGDPKPAQIVQFTSSGLQNIMNDKVRLADRSFAFAQRMIRSKIGADRLAWEKKSETVLSFPAAADVAPRLRAKMRRSPLLLPTRGWPKGTTIAQPPDWSWHVTILRDERPDHERPKPAQPFSLFPGDPNRKDADIAERRIDGYHRTANRHARQLERLNNSRQMLFINNLGVVTFGKTIVREKSGGQTVEVPAAIHELYSAQPDPDLAQPKLTPEVYVKHIALLEDPFVKAPEIDVPP
jgi:hypothetical protein